MKNIKGSDNVKIIKFLDNLTVTKNRNAEDRRMHIFTNRICLFLSYYLLSSSLNVYINIEKWKRKRYSLLNCINIINLGLCNRQLFLISIYFSVISFCFNGNFHELLFCWTISVGLFPPWIKSLAQEEATGAGYL